MDVSVKISDEDIELIDGIRSQCRARGIRVTKKRIIAESLKVAAEHQDDLMKRIKRKDNTKEMTEQFLKNEGKFDFGPNWLEEIDTTL